MPKRGKKKKKVDKGAIRSKSINSTVMEQKDNDNKQIEQHKEKKRLRNKAVLTIKGWLHGNVICLLCLIVSAIIPILVFRFKPYLISALSEVSVSTQGTSAGKGSRIVFGNSEAFIERYATPFSAGVCLIISLAIVFVVVGIGLKCLKKHGYFLQNANKWLSVVEVIVVIISALVLIYNYEGKMDYEGYGIYTQEIEEKYFVEIKPGPTIASYIEPEGADNPFYYLLVKLSEIAHAIMQNIELYIGIFSAMILPLKIWGSKEGELNSPKHVNKRGPSS